MANFSGSYNMVVDDKNRLRLPAKMKPKFEQEQVYITIGSNGCLLLMSESVKADIWKKVDENPKASTEHKRTLRYISAHTYPIEEDGQGRYVIPSKLREYADIDKDVVYNGYRDKLELWSAKRWEEYSSFSSQEELATKLDDLGEFGF